MGVNIQRIHLHLSKESLAFGQQLARKKRISVSKLVESLFMAGRNHVRSGKPFSQRWAGKVGLRAPGKMDRRATQLAKKYL